jgi:hypothetical protein
VTLTGAAGSSITNRILGDVVHNSSFNGSYTVGYSFTPNTNIVVTHVRHYADTKVSIWTDGGALVTSQTVSSTPGVWIETPLSSPVLLQAGVRYRVGVFSGGLNAGNYYRFDLPTVFTNGNLHSSYYNSGDNFPAFTDSPRWYFVDLRYSVGTEIPVPVTPSFSGNFTNGVWSGNVALTTLSSNVVLRASDADGHFGQSASFAMLY